MKRTFLLLILISSLLFKVSGQIVDPVSWNFSFEMKGEREAELIFKAQIDPPWHMYSAYLPDGGPIATKAWLNESDSYTLVGDLIEVTKPKIKFDEGFKMDLGTISGRAEFRQKVRLTGSGSVTITGEMEFQVCDDATCLPPKLDEFSITVTPVAGSTAGESRTESSPAGGSRTDASSAGESGSSVRPADGTVQGDREMPSVNGGEEAAEDDRQTRDLSGFVQQEKTGDAEENEEPLRTGGENMELLRAGGETDGDIASVPSMEGERSFWGFFWLAFGLGLLALLTPCVFPMIPMTVSFFMQGSGSRARGIIRGLIFGLSIVAIYTSLGVIVSITNVGPNAANALSTHWIPNLIFFALFIIFAFSFFGMFELILPSSWVNKADSKAESGGLGGTFFLALTTVLVSFSCTGPIVGALLVEATGGLALKPILGMFGFALAFAIPFTLFALFPSWLKELPKSGGWLNSVKVVLGFIVLAFSMKFLLPLDPSGKILTRELYLSVWIVLSFLLGLYFLGKLRFAHDSDVPHVTVPRLLLSIASFTFMIFLFLGLFGYELKNVAPLLPHKSPYGIDLSQRATFTGTPAVVSGAAGQEECVPEKYTDLFHMPHGLQGFYTLEEGLACAAVTGKPVLIDFKGHFCSNCKKMEAAVWSDPEVLRTLSEDFIIVALYTDDRTRLPESEWYVSEEDGKEKKTIGQQNVDYEIRMFKTNTIPLYAIMDPAGNMVIPPKGTDLDVQSYLSWLREGHAAAIR